METTSGPQTSKTQPELINLGYISSGEDEEKEYSNDPYSFAMDVPNGPSKFSMKIPSTSNDTGIGSLIRDAPTSSFSPRNWSRSSSTSASNLSTPTSKPGTPKDILQLAVNSMNSPPDFNVRKDTSSRRPEDFVREVVDSIKPGMGMFSQKLTSMDKEEPSSSSDLLKVSIPTATKSQKRKRLKKASMNVPTFETDAQKAEQERLDRIQKMRESTGNFQDRAAYEPQVLYQSFPIQPSTSREKYDDEIVVLDEKPATPSSVKRSRVEEEEQNVVVLSSDDESEMRPGPSTNFNQPSFFTSQQLQQMRIAQMLKTQGLKLHQQKQEIRPRRNSNDYENSELTRGLHLVNAGKPAEDPDIFVAEHLTDILQPHQLGGVRFLYDNIIESLQDFNDSAGFGCILAHSMGLGKTIQVITFTDIFFRATKSKKALIICPVNTIQNWFNEFEKWMPKTAMTSNLEYKTIRDFEVFLLSDSVKGLKARADLIAEWHRQGGVLIMGYEMFRILVRNKGMAKKKPTQNRTESIRMFDIDENEKVEDFDEVDEKELSESLYKGLVEALLDPGPDLVVCDEGHRIKNLNSHVSGALNSIKTRRRIVLTGYPIQNNLMEYYCMVNFVRPDFLGTKKNFSVMFEKPIKNGQCIDSTPKDKKLSEQRIHVLTEKLKGFVHRRSQNILKNILPESKEYVVLVRKSPIQHALYRSFVLYAQAEMQAQNANFYNPLKAYAICVKILNHPDLLYKAMLLKNKEIASLKGDDLNENTRDSSNSNSKSHSPPLPTFGLGLTEPKMEQQGYYGNQQQNWNYGGRSNKYQNGYTNQFSSFQHPQPTFSQMVNPSYQQNNGPNSNFSDFQQPFFPSNNGSSQHWHSNGMDQVHSQSVPDFSSWQNFGGDQKPGTSKGLSTSESTSTFSTHEIKPKQRGRPAKKRTLASILYGDEFDDNSIKYDWADLALRQYIPEIAENSYKLLLAIELINETTRRGEKILFFSGSVLTLDMLENFLLKRYKLATSDGGEFLWEKNVNYCRFDGTTNATDREKYMNMFNSNPDIYLFLISTKAGSLGVNLVSATRVIIFDASWNPCHDAQAVCRIYRYGQQKRTFIYRLIVNNCMEKAIFNRQISKQGLQQKVVDEKHVDANVLTKELENLLSYDESQDVIIGNSNVKWEIEDSLLESVVKRHRFWFAEAPFLHESLMLERQAGLSEVEKEEARLLYDRERLGLNRYDQVDTNYSHPRPFGMSNEFEGRDFFNQKQHLIDDLSMRMGRPMRPSPMPGVLVLNQPGMPSSYASPTRPELVSNRPIWDPNRPALRLIPPEPPAPKSFISPIISSNWIRLPCEITLPYAQSLPNTELLPQYATVYPNDEVVLIRNVQTTPNKFFIKLKNGDILNATDDTQTLKIFEGILGPAFFQPLAHSSSLRPRPAPIQPGEIIELD